MPIGNKDDITLRMLMALEDCDVIFSDKPLMYLPQILEERNLVKEIILLNSTNTLYADESQVDDVESRILSGQTVVLVSSEGQVGIADPGNQFIQRCIDKNIPYTVLPGANVAINSFVFSGITHGDFMVSCNMENQRSILDERRQSNNPLVILVWKSQLNDILDYISTEYNFGGSYRKKITICSNMTMSDELIIHDWCDTVAENPAINLIGPDARISIVISQFYDGLTPTNEIKNF